VSRSLRVPIVGKQDSGRLWKLLPFLAGAIVIALIWANRRSGKRGNEAVGTAPAGAPPMRERDPAAASVSSQPRVEQPGPMATPGTTSAATAGVGTVASQPAPIAEADAPGTAAPEQLATAGPDMAAWVSELVSDTDATGATDEPSAATSGTSASASRPESAPRDEAEAMPTPAEETTAVSANEGQDWVNPNGERSCPEAFPIKGNASSRIYHRPGESTYEATIPEICFASEEAAVALGYRARKR
jgi:hypothetical protein